jgi:hypothetical protein
MNAAFKGADFSVNPLCSVHWIISNDSNQNEELHIGNDSNHRAVE